MRLSRQFEKALIYATRIHGGQLRKKTRIPYIAHILGVCAIAMEYGANETEAIAALLHDAVEDCGGAKRLRDIERKLAKKSRKSCRAALTQIKRQNLRGWNERSPTWLTFETHRCRRNSCQLQTNCTMSVRS